MNNLKKNTHAGKTKPQSKPKEKEERERQANKLRLI